MMASADRHLLLIEDRRKIMGMNAVNREGYRADPLGSRRNDCNAGVSDRRETA